METLQEGTILQEKYRIEKILGSGGMGSIYLAYGINLGKHWAIKEMMDFFPDGHAREKAIAQFRTEAQILAHLHHPSLPRVVDYFEEGGRHYLVMDYIEGQSLKDYMETIDPFPDVEMVIVWTEAIATTLHFLHSRQPPIIFRDLKPANVMLSREGQIKLIDFGISKIFMPADATRTGAKGMGSPGFSPPEQYSGTTDARSDIYSLGALTYYLLMGTPPADALSRLMQGASLLSTMERNPCVTKEMEQVLFKALEMDPKKRFQSAEDFRKALGALRKGGPPERNVGYSSSEVIPPVVGEEISCIAGAMREMSPSDKPPEGDILENICGAFRHVFHKKNGWKEEHIRGFDFSFTQGIIEKRWLLLRLIPLLDENSFAGFVDFSLTAQKELLHRCIHPGVKFYFLCLFQHSPNPGPVIDRAEELSKSLGSAGLRSRYLIPVNVATREVFDGHIPESHKDSNDLRDVFLNIRIAVKRI